ncbi:MAG: GDSL-type esterase/lipase family protein [Planctomycetota bacterium]
MKKTFKRKVLVLVLLLVALYACLEGISFTGLLLLKHFRKVTYKPYEYGLSAPNRRDIEQYLAGERAVIEFDRVLGWTVRPGAVVPLEKINKQGIRSDREYSDIPEPGVIRASAFGDSFVYCQEVRNDQTWEELLAESLPDFEVLNYGVGGYGLDQAYIRYMLEGARNWSHFVFIGFFNDYFGRNVCIFPPAMYARSGVRFMPFLKPRYLLEGDGIVLRTKPLPFLEDYERFLLDDRAVLDLIEGDDHFLRLMYRKGPMDFLPSVRLVKLIQYGLAARKPENRIILADKTYSTESEAYRVTTKVLDQFYLDVLGHGALPVVVFFPNSDEVNRFREQGTKACPAIVEHVERKGYRYVDLLDAFHECTARDVRACFASGGHYSAAGNKIVAEFIRKFLEESDLLDPTVIRQLCVEEGRSRHQQM